MLSSMREDCEIISSVVFAMRHLPTVIIPNFASVLGISLLLGLRFSHSQNLLSLPIVSSMRYTTTREVTPMLPPTAF
jgi:membrane protease YdiL (CAAX protease family)